MNDGSAMNIRLAVEDDFEILTSISFQAKQVWRYPKENFKIWQSELTITPEYINQNVVYLAEVKKRVIGYYSIIEPANPLPGDPKVCDLDHIYVLPEFIGQKFGSALYKHAKSTAQKMGYCRIKAVADPHAKGFYEKMAAKYSHDIESNIPGRRIPVFMIDCA